MSEDEYQKISKNLISVKECAKKNNYITKNIRRSLWQKIDQNDVPKRLQDKKIEMTGVEYP